VKLGLKFPWNIIVVEFHETSRRPKDPLIYVAIADEGVQGLENFLLYPWAHLNLPSLGTPHHDS
jgi:hypothetical protein